MAPLSVGWEVEWFLYHRSHRVRMTAKKYAYAEARVRSIKTECFRRLTFLGVVGLRRALREYLENYYREAA